MFTYLYKFSAVEDGDASDAPSRLEVARDSFSTVLPLLEFAIDDRVGVTRSAASKAKCLTTLNCLQVAMSGLKVVGALVGRSPQAIAELPPAEFKRLGRCVASVDASSDAILHWTDHSIDACSCLAALRDRRLSATVSQLSSSLLAALFPASVE